MFESRLLNKDYIRYFFKCDKSLNVAFRFNTSNTIHYNLPMKYNKIGKTKH